MNDHTRLRVGLDRLRARPAFTPTALALAISALMLPTAAVQAADGRKIEEVVVTAEKRDSTLQDTSISITAFDASFLQDFGIRNQEDLQNYIPATTIQPYDVAIRGVGRNFRTIGGDPGISTYFNGAYSEDFGIASTEDGLYDIDRIEILRGPQGTLYGRNAVGGAVNFYSAKPEQEFGAQLRTIVGTYETVEVYGMVTGPIIQDVLAARLTGTKRRRDGYINDTSPFGTDYNDLGDENYAISFDFTPTDDIEMYARVNERSYRRTFNGGAGHSPIVTFQDTVDGTEFDTTRRAFGWRNTAIVPLQPGETVTRTFTNPATGATVVAAPIRPGIDPNGCGAAQCNTNWAFGFNDPNRIHVSDRKNLDQGDLDIDTNGTSREFFDQSAVQYNFNWDVNENVAVQYSFAYTDFTYERNIDRDAVGSTQRSYEFDVIQQNENVQHEVQVDFNYGKLSVTSGVFAYDSTINQRLDLYDPIDAEGRFTRPANNSILAGFFAGDALDRGNAGSDNRIGDIREAELLFKSGRYVNNRAAALGGPQLNVLDSNGTATIATAAFGDTGDRLRDLHFTPGTFFAWDNDLGTKAYAAYTQGTYEFNEEFALVLGLRWARDERTATERLIGYNELGLTKPSAQSANPTYSGLLLAFNNPAIVALTPACTAANAGDGGALCRYNVLTGALDGATLAPTGNAPVRYNGVPIQFNTYRPLDNSWDVWTWRVNLDWTPNEDTLIYASATTGWRAGGFNLGFSSSVNPIYEDENVLSFETGYKGQLFDNSLQLNLSAYVYLYDDIQTIVELEGVDSLGVPSVGTNVINVPEATTLGLEAEVLWLATEQLTFGGNISFTKAEYDSSLPIVDNENPNAPSTLFTPGDRASNIKGNRLMRIPEWKFTAWANYTQPLDRWGTVDYYSTISWTDEYFFTPFNDSFDTAPAFWRWDARANWTSPSETWKVSMFVNNIIGDLGVREQERFPEYQAYLRKVTTTDPRLVGLEVIYNFKP